MCKCSTESIFLMDDKRTMVVLQILIFHTIRWSGIFSITFTVVSSVFEGDVLLEVYLSSFHSNLQTFKTQFISEFSL